MRHPLVLVLILVTTLFSVFFINGVSAFTAHKLSSRINKNPHNSKINSFHAGKSIIEKVIVLYHSSSNSNSKAIVGEEGGGGDQPYLQHLCPSCNYVYDENKGFKKRIPPGWVDKCISDLHIHRYACHHNNI